MDVVDESKTDRNHSLKGQRDRCKSFSLAFVLWARYYCVFMLCLPFTVHLDVYGYGDDKSPFGLKGGTSYFFIFYQFFT